MNEQYVLKTYKALHCIPERSLEEKESAVYIAEELRKMRYDVKTDFAGYTVMAELDSGTPGPTLALRADMDALEFIINNEKKCIHACGHDANSAMVLATAKNIAEGGIKTGRIKFVFQPAEENGEGAELVVKSGVLSDVDEIVGIHLRPIAEARVGEATPALYHGASHMAEYKITGQAAHGARQHLGVNAIDAASMAISAVNAVRVDPRISHSAKVTHIHSEGDAYNIIPETVYMRLDLRAQNNEVMDMLKMRVQNAITASVQSIGAKAEEVYSKLLPASEYDSELIETARESITSVLGVAMEPIVTPGGEDFHNFTKMLGIKSAYIGIGADLSPGLHKPEMTFDFKALEHGEAILTDFVYRRLGRV
jgi:amidohydrolase